jgi:diadenosine tetraphosphate (Ap4A) HIT family hydrolase
MSCDLCQRLEKLKSEPGFIVEWEESIWMLGDHQYFPGYTMLVSKNHCKEITDMPEVKAQKIFSELLLAHRVVENVFSPWKMNLCSLGNRVPHLHWHLFPRYESDPHRLDPVWLRMHEFSSRVASETEMKSLVMKIRSALASL